MFKKVPVPASGGVMLTYHCNAQCAHCSHHGSPLWPEDWPSPERLDMIFSALAPHIKAAPEGPDRVNPNFGLHFSGGECFLNLPLLLEAVEGARHRKIPSLFVETNAFWADNDRETRKILGELKTRGLSGLLVSVNPMVLEYVSFVRVDRLIRMGFEIFGEDLIVYERDRYHRAYERRMKEAAEADILLTRLWERYVKVPAARTAEHAPLRKEEILLHPEDDHTRSRGGVSDFLAGPCVPPPVRQWHNHFDNYGNYLPGYCAGLSYGNLSDLERLLKEGIDPAQKPLLAYLMDQDLAGLYTMALSEGYRERPDGYTCRCHLCQDLRLHFFRTGLYEELAPRQFYEMLSISREETPLKEDAVPEYGR